jgi:hypothetical protein
MIGVREMIFGKNILSKMKGTTRPNLMGKFYSSHEKGVARNELNV